MSNTSNLVLPYLAAGQAQKHVTLNESLRKLDAIIQLAVVSATTTAEPASPADGAVWILPAGKTGAHWSAFTAGRLAYYRDGAWVEIAPRQGWLAFIKDTGRLLGFNGSVWSPFAASLSETNIFAAPQTFASAHDASLKLDIIEEELTFSGPSIPSTATIPNGSICFGVSERVTQAVTGAPSFKVGISGEASKFGDLLGLSLGSTNFGIIGPTAFSPTRRLWLRPTARELHRWQGPPRHSRAARHHAAKLRTRPGGANEGRALNRSRRVRL